MRKKGEFGCVKEKRMEETCEKIFELK